MIIDGIEISFERRRYGRTTYTWAHAKINMGDGDNDWESLGDPWPCVTPKKSDLRASLWSALMGRVLPPTTEVVNAR